jgi:hypothetical protein
MLFTFSALVVSFREIFQVYCCIRFCLFGCKL